MINNPIIDFTLFNRQLNSVLMSIVQFSTSKFSYPEVGGGANQC